MKRLHYVFQSSKATETEASNSLGLNPVENRLLYYLLANQFSVFLYVW